MDHVGKTCFIWSDDDDDWVSAVIDDWHPQKGFHVQCYNGDAHWVRDEADIKFEDPNDAVDALFSPTPKGDASGSRDGNVPALANETNASPSPNEVALEEKSKSDKSMGTEEVVIMKSGGRVSGKGTNVAIDDSAYVLDDTLGKVVDPPDQGILLRGKVTQANNLPADKEGGQAFFKVVYAAGGKQSALFRCKTPVFESKTATDETFPVWQYGSFLFEVIIAGLTEGTATISGEIIVVVYRSRPQGGNVFVGQSVFDLGNLARTGTVDYRNPNLECRTTSGEYPLVERSGNQPVKDAEIEIRLELYWNKTADSAAVYANSAMQSSKVGTSTRSSHASRPDTSGSVRGMKSRSPSVRSITSKSSAAARSTVSKRSKTPEGVRKIASAGQRRMEEEQKRIEKGNRLLQLRLNTTGGKKRGDDDSVGVYSQSQSSKQNGAKGAAGGAGSQGRGRASSAERKRRASITSTTAPATFDTLLEQLTKLKKENADIEKENVATKAKLSALKTSAKRHTQSMGKLQKYTPPSPQKNQVQRRSSGYGYGNISSAPQSKFLKKVNEIDASNASLSASEKAERARKELNDDLFGDLAADSFDEELERRMLEGSDAVAKRNQQSDENHNDDDGDLYGRIGSDTKAGQDDGDLYGRNDQKLENSEDDYDLDFHNETGDEKESETALTKNTKRGGAEGNIGKGLPSYMADKKSAQRSSSDFLDAAAKSPSPSKVTGNDKDAFSDTGTGKNRFSPPRGGALDLNFDFDMDSQTEFDDPELTDLMNEYRTLQNMRRDVLERTKKAKEACAKAEDDTAAATEQRRRAKRLLQPNTEPVSLLGGTHGDKTHLQETKTFEVDDIPEMDDVALAEELRKLENEIAKAEASADEGIHYGDVADTLAEETAKLQALKAMHADLEAECEQVRFERDSVKERLHVLLEDKVAYKLRDGITLMRASLLRLRREHRLEGIRKATEAIEIEMMRRDLSRKHEIDQVEQVVI